MIESPIEYLNRRIAEILAEHPDLTIAGFKWTDRRGQPQLADQPPPTLSINEMYFCGEFLDRYCTPKRTAFPSSPGSYGLKHAVERFASHHGESMWIPNGALILAALLLCYPVRRFDHGGPNALIGTYVKRAAGELRRGAAQ